MKWFVNEFLPSLEERYRQRGGKLWLTAKQANVCKCYMHGIKTAYRGCYGLNVGEKQYVIQVAPNGCVSFMVLANGWVTAE